MLSKNNIISDWYQLHGEPQILTIGRISTTNVHPTRKLPFWALGIVFSGSRTIKIKNLNLKLTTGDYYLLPPNIKHTGIDLDQSDIFFVHFNMEWTNESPPAENIKDSIILPVSGQFPSGVNSFQYLDYINTFYKIEPINKNFHSSQIRALLFQLSLFMQIKEMGYKQNNLLAEEIFTFINKNFMNEITSINLEDEFHLSYKQLNNIFKKQYKTTIKQKMIDLRIQHACNLLMSGVSIESVVTQTGFSDYFYFLKCFKKRTGLTPRQLQKKYLNL